MISFRSSSPSNAARIATIDRVHGRADVYARLLAEQDSIAMPVATCALYFGSARCCRTSMHFGAYRHTIVERYGMWRR